MFNAKTELENKAYRNEQEAHAAKAALRDEAKAGKSKGNILQTITRFAKGFAKKSKKEEMDVHEAQEAPATQLKPQKSSS